MITLFKAVLIAIRVPADQRSLKQGVLLSGALSTSAFFITAVLRLTSTIVLTRLLTPETFGVFSVLLTFTFIISMFTDLGVRSLILTREGDVEEEFLYACWTMQILRGLVLSITILLIAATIFVLQSYNIFRPESSYAAPVLPYAIALTSISFLISSTEYPNRYMYERKMKFGKITLTDISYDILSFILLVGLILYLRNIWALVWGGVVAACLQVIVSRTLYSGPRMKVAWNREYMKIVFNHGKWIASHSALSAVTTMADRIILGIFLPSSSFGFYHIARQLIDMPTLLLNKIHAQIGLQLFRGIHEFNDTWEFQVRYYKYRRFFDVFSMVGSGTLIILAPILIEIIYDDRYREVAFIVQCLAIGLALTGFSILREAFSAQRRFREMAVLSAIQAITIWVGLIVALPIFNSALAAFLVVALHRVPEILVLLIMGYREGWVISWREVLHMPLIGVGMLLGYGVDFAIRNTFF